MGVGDFGSDRMSDRSQMLVFRQHLLAFEGREMRSRACCCLSHRAALITGSVLLALVLAMLAGCQGLPANVANCSVTPTPPTNTSVVPPATEPPTALCAFPLTIATPRNSASVHSPVPIVANAAAPDQITRSGFTWMALRSFTRRPRRSINTSGCPSIANFCLG
jgi:hypothetical protein